MADNTVLNAGAGGDTVATDDIAGVKHQRVKIEHGADGSATDVSSASPLPVTLANTGANATAVKTDGSATTQPVSAAALPLPAGAATSAKQDTGNASLASLDGKTVAVDTGAVVVASSALPTGAATEAKQDAGNASVDSIDQKLVAAQAADFDTGGGTEPTQMVGIALPANGGPVAGGTSTNPLQVSLANHGANATAVKTDGSAVTQPVSDAAGSLTVDAPVGTPVFVRLSDGGSAIATLPVSAASLPLPTGAATLAEQQTQTTHQSNAATSLGVLDDWDESDRAKVNPIVGQAGVAGGAGAAGATVQRVVLATDTTVPNVSGTVAHDAGDSGNPVKVGYRADTTFQAAVADGDRVDALADVYGHVRARIDHANNWGMHFDGSSAQTDLSVQGAPGAGLSVYITDIVFSSGAATAINLFFEEGSTKILGPFYLEAVAGRGMHIKFATPKKCTANTAVTLTTSAAIAHSVDVTGFIAP
jgi:hypothetical protein